MAKLIALVWIVAYVIFVVRGLRNRSGPRWFAVAGVFALSLWIQSDWWRIAAGCYSDRYLAILFLWAGIVNVMFVHHVIQRPHGNPLSGHPLSPTRSETAPQIRAANAAVIRGLVFAPVAWSALNALRTFDREPSLMQRAIAMLQHGVSWTALVLLVCAAILTPFALWFSHANPSAARRWGR